MKPEYRIKIEVYDDKVGEVVAFYDTPLSAVDEDNVPHLMASIRRFNDNKANHEATYYPKESEEV